MMNSFILLYNNNPKKPNKQTNRGDVAKKKLYLKECMNINCNNNHKTHFSFQVWKGYVAQSIHFSISYLDVEPTLQFEDFLEVLLWSRVKVVTVLIENNYTAN